MTPSLRHRPRTPRRSQKRIRRRYRAERRFTLARAGGGPALGRGPRLPADHDGRRTAVGGFTAHRARRCRSTSPTSALVADPTCWPRARRRAVARSAGPARGGRVRAAQCARRGRRATGSLRERAGCDVRERDHRRSLDPATARARIRRPGFDRRPVAAYAATAMPTLSAARRALAAEGALADDTSTSASSPARTPPIRQLVGIWGALKGSLLTMVVTLPDRLPGRRARGALSRGICAAEPLDRPDRGLDQQPRGGALDHLRPARPRGVPRDRSRTCPLGAAGRRADAGADDHAGDRHRRPQRDQGGAALDPRRARSAIGASADPGGVPPCAAAGPARHPHRHDHRHGARAGRDRAAADDRHARLHRHAAGRLHRSRHRAAGADLPVVRRGRAAASSRRPSAAIIVLLAVPAGDERPRHLPAQQIREDAGDRT